MHHEITREQMESEQERVRRELAEYVNEITDNGKALIPVCVGIMEGEDPDITPKDRFDAAGCLIQLSESVPVALEHIQSAKAILAGNADLR